MPAHWCNWRCYPGYHIEPYGKEKVVSDFAKIAYEAYVKSCGGKSVHGEDLPTWEEARPEIRVHWDAAAQAVVRAVVGDGD